MFIELTREGGYKELINMSKVSRVEHCLNGGCFVDGERFVTPYEDVRARLIQTHDIYGGGICED